MIQYLVEEALRAVAGEHDARARDAREFTDKNAAAQARVDAKLRRGGR